MCLDSYNDRSFDSLNIVLLEVFTIYVKTLQSEKNYFDVSGMCGQLRKCFDCVNVATSIREMI